MDQERCACRIWGRSRCKSTSRTTASTRSTLRCSSVAAPASRSRSTGRRTSRSTTQSTSSATRSPAAERSLRAAGSSSAFRCTCGESSTPGRTRLRGCSACLWGRCVEAAAPRRAATSTRSGSRRRSSGRRSSAADAARLPPGNPAPDVGAEMCLRKRNSGAAVLASGGAVPLSTGGAGVPGGGGPIAPLEQVQVAGLEPCGAGARRMLCCKGPCGAGGSTLGRAMPAVDQTEWIAIVVVWFNQTWGTARSRTVCVLHCGAADALPCQGVSTGPLTNCTRPTQQLL